MVVAFLSLGLLFLFTELFIETIPAPNRYFVGGVLIVWAILRGWLAWEREKRRRLEDDEDNQHPDKKFRRR